eukprot:11200302-Lingulodinium_polyedra.AAC.1
MPSMLGLHMFLAAPMTRRHPMTKLRSARDAPGNKSVETSPAQGGKGPSKAMPPMTRLHTFSGGPNDQGA